jgi:hypothetical protein
MNEPKQKIMPDQPLSEWHLALLSAAAARVYGIIWGQMNFKGATVFWMSDAELSRRSRVTLQNLPAVKTELSSARLLVIKPGQPGQPSPMTRYEFVESPDGAETTN